MNRHDPLGPMDRMTERAVVVLLSGLLVAGIVAVVRAGPEQVRHDDGDRVYSHWSEDPRIDGPWDVPPDYYGPSPGRHNYTFQRTNWSYGLNSSISEWFVGYEYRFPATVIRTNALGFRDGPMRRRASPEVLRVFAVGDSRTFGLAVNGSATWPEQLEDDLSADLQRPVQVVNAGVPGYGIRDVYGMITERVQGLDPDMIVVGITRADGLSEQRVERVQDRLERQHPDASRQRLRELREAWKRRYFRNFTARWDTNSSVVRRYIMRIGARTEVPTVFLSMNPDPAFEDRVSRFTRDRAVRFVAAPDRLRGGWYTVLPQDAHPDGEGYAILAERLGTVLRRQYDLAALGRNGTAR